MRGDNCWVESLFGITVFISSDTSLSSGNSSNLDDTENMISEIISMNNLAQEFLALSLMLNGNNGQLVELQVTLIKI